MAIGFGAESNENPNQRYIGTYVHVISSSKPEVAGLWKEECGGAGYLCPFVDFRLNSEGKPEYFLNDDSRAYKFSLMDAHIKPTKIEKILGDLEAMNNKTPAQPTSTIQASTTQPPIIKEENKLKACLKKFLQL